MAWLCLYKLCDREHPWIAFFPFFLNFLFDYCLRRHSTMWNCWVKVCVFLGCVCERAFDTFCQIIRLNFSSRRFLAQLASGLSDRNINSFKYLWMIKEVVLWSAEGEGRQQLVCAQRWCCGWYPRNERPEETCYLTWRGDCIPGPYLNFSLQNSSSFCRIRIIRRGFQHLQLHLEKAVFHLAWL